MTKTILVCRHQNLSFHIWYNEKHYNIPKSGEQNLINLLNNNSVRFNTRIKWIEFGRYKMIYDVGLVLERR